MCKQGALELQQKNRHLVKLQYFVYLIFDQIPQGTCIPEQNVVFFGYTKFLYIRIQ